ncbi:hypothetical protein GMA92_05175 [Turicibacter sanguinis]|uniref:DUF3168 domain-containing protein n=1 Tax=Turicibacter sanguinis TaxID=154288 RepID=A0A9X4XFC9_9FIRM|nr:hypothetical protein [uncultured Turicibacter sp.]MTK20830.1 hypothetical protein [Turicibacter sanguinis]MTK72074.1 hypothetical protein [Turicibacter sanguinis]
MSRTLKIRTIFKSLIEECGCKAYYERANKNVLYPYAVFEFESTDITDISKREIEIIIDIWDKTDDSSNIEVLTDTIIHAINHKFLLPEDIPSLRIYGVRKRSLPDEDSTLKRRQIECSIIYFD